MLNLVHFHPEVYKEFMKGEFTVQRSKRIFSKMSIDQAHEQLNAVAKGDGGVIGLTENEDFSRRWTVSFPEVCRILSEFECQKRRKGAV